MTTKKWNQPKCTTTMNVVHTMEYYSAKKKYEIMNLQQNIMELSEQNQVHKVKYFLDRVAHTCIPATQKALLGKKRATTKNRVQRIKTHLNIYPYLFLT
jgi:hypothetical protein